MLRRIYCKWGKRNHRERQRILGELDMPFKEIVLETWMGKDQKNHRETNSFNELIQYVIWNYIPTYSATRSFLLKLKCTWTNLRTGRESKNEWDNTDLEEEIKKIISNFGLLDTSYLNPLFVLMPYSHFKSLPFLKAFLWTPISQRGFRRAQKGCSGVENSSYANTQYFKSLYKMTIQSLLCLSIAWH